MSTSAPHCLSKTIGIKDSVAYFSTPAIAPKASAYCSNPDRKTSNSPRTIISIFHPFSCTCGLTLSGFFSSHSCKSGCHFERKGRRPLFRTAIAIPPTELCEAPTFGPAFRKISRVEPNKLYSKFIARILLKPTTIEVTLHSCARNNLN